MFWFFFIHVNYMGKLPFQAFVQNSLREITGKVRTMPAGQPCSGLPPGETRGIHVNSASFLFKTRGDLAEFTWFVRWATVLSNTKVQHGSRKDIC